MNNSPTNLAVEWSEIWTITGVGYSVVFFALVLLVFLFQSLPKVLNLGVRKRIREVRDRMGPKEVEVQEEEKYLSGEISAAIALSISLYLKEQHDEESGIITIKRVARTYSPWSSKIYGINNNM